MMRNTRLKLNDLKNQLLNLEINIEKKYKVKYEEKIQNIKENFDNQFKQSLIQFYLKIQTFEKEKDNLINEKAEYLNIIKEYEKEVERLSKEINEYKVVTPVTKTQYLTKNTEIENLLKSANFNDDANANIITENFLRGDFDTQYFFASEINEEGLKANVQKLSKANIPTKTFTPSFFVKR